MTVEEKLQYATKKWKLMNGSILYEKEKKAVYQANTEKWGKVIVKFHCDKEELFREFYMMNGIKGGCCCKVYAFDKEYGILVEEQICPGNVLREERDVSQRVKYFSKVFSGIHVGEIEKDYYNTYLDWLKTANEFCREHILDNKIKRNMMLAYQIGEEMFEKYPERVLLHGDLHHDNILLDNRGGYCVIDPKGVIGPEIFDVPRFLLNEFDFVGRKERKRHIEMVIQLIGEILGYCVWDMKKLLFMEIILANIWNMEDGEEPDLDWAGLELGWNF